MTGRSAENTDEASQLNHFQTPWRSLGIGVGAIGAPVATSCLHPVLGLSLFAVQAAMFMIIFGAALFGTPTISDRAFRLLRWLAGRPEPAAPSGITSRTSLTGPYPDGHHKQATSFYEFLDEERVSSAELLLRRRDDSTYLVEPL